MVLGVEEVLEAAVYAEAAAERALQESVERVERPAEPRVLQVIRTHLGG